ncbi:hypothetical protein ONK27_26585, partial [Salmonella enterica subsp. enterica serovar Virginia]|nr:hypothetical protein [Salmonella enterica subsp. enterica serovar Virginia]
MRNRRAGLQRGAKTVAKEMRASGDGWFTLDVSGVTPGTEYNFVLSDGMVVPDPASRAQ